ncbi:MAG: DUF6090 family protein [Saprospiraceae bacterium]|nr:DUF6090 family protein [Saprospiraceae bacterium]
MLTLLRKIRRSMVEKGSTRKYLLYAIGEIALVVIGILIALQINNWNNKRIQKINEINSLQLLEDNLKEQREQAVFSRRLSKDRLVLGIEILDFLDESNVFHDSLSQDFRIITKESTSNYTVSSAYESIKEIKLSNDTLAEKIHELYEVLLPRIDSRTIISENITEFFESYVLQHFDLVELSRSHTFGDIDYKDKVSQYIEKQWFRSHFGLRPKNYQFLRNDPEFRNLLKYSFEMRTGQIISLERVISAIDEISIIQESELNL